VEAETYQRARHLWPEWDESILNSRRERVTVLPGRYLGQCHGFKGSMGRRFNPEPGRS
jgi:hypothetical protein